MFNQAVVSLVKALFIANKEFIPHQKWLIHMSRSLKWTPNDWEDRLRGAMSTGDMTISSLKQRRFEGRLFCIKQASHLTPREPTAQAWPV
jgi:hypothetical protein